MRTTREILEIVLENEFGFRMGLCGWVLNLGGLGVISHSECVKVSRYINDHRPFNTRTIIPFSLIGSAYYWKPGKLEPRVKWLKRHIKKLK